MNQFEKAGAEVCLIAVDDLLSRESALFRSFRFAPALVVG